MGNEMDAQGVYPQTPLQLHEYSFFKVNTFNEHTQIFTNDDNSKAPPASCVPHSVIVCPSLCHRVVPHTVIVCALCRSPILDSRNPPTYSSSSGVHV